MNKKPSKIIVVRADYDGYKDPKKSRIYSFRKDNYFSFDIPDEKTLEIERAISSIVGVAEASFALSRSRNEVNSMSVDILPDQDWKIIESRIMLCLRMIFPKIPIELISRGELLKRLGK